METIRIVDLTGWLQWEVLAAEPPPATDAVVNGFQTVAAISLGFNSLRSAYPRATFRLGELELPPERRFEDLVADVRSRRASEPGYTPFGRDPVTDLLAAIEDPQTGAIWMYGAGHPSNIAGAEKEVGQMLTALADRCPPDHPPADVLKPLLGYCAMTPVLLYAHELQLVRAVHAPLLVDFSIGMSDPEVNETEAVVGEIAHLINGPANEIRIPGLRPRNERARELYARGESISGFVQGGLLQAIAFWLTEQREGRLRCPRSLSEPRILFVELLDLGTEQEKMDEIMSAIRSGFFAVSAIVVGYLRANDSLPKPEQEERAERARQGLDALGRVREDAPVPVFDGLQVGHYFPNHPLSFGPAALKLGDGARLVFEAAPAAS